MEANHVLVHEMRKKTVEWKHAQVREHSDALTVLPIHNVFSDACKWNDWNDWSECSKPCGGGEQTRTRTVKDLAINGGSDCRGKPVEIRYCNEHECPGEVMN